MRLFILILFFTAMFIDNAIHENAKNKKLGLKEIVVDHGLELYRELQNHESDCFKKVTIQLLQGCDSKQFDTLENMDYAVMLTICELKSAGIPIPDECLPLSKDSTKGRNQYVKQCVFKMARLPQTWTTYSVLMCFAIHQPIEKEILEKLHTNITLNQVKNFNILQEQQERLIEWRNEEFNTLDKLKDSQLQVLNRIGRVQRTHTRTADQIQLIYEALVLLHNQTSIIVNKHDQLIQYHANELQNQLNQLSIRQTSEIDQFVDTIVQGYRLIDSNIKEMIRIQEETIQNWSLAKDVQSDYLNNWIESMNTFNNNFNQILNKSLESVAILKEDIFIIRKQMKLILIPFQWIFNIITDFKRTALNAVIYASFFYHAYSFFRVKSTSIRIFLSIIISIVHQYILYLIFPTFPIYPYETNLKVILILAEWLIRDTFTKHQTKANINRSNNDSSSAPSNLSSRIFTYSSNSSDYNSDSSIASSLSSFTSRSTTSSGFSTNSASSSSTSISNSSSRSNLSNYSNSRSVSKRNPPLIRYKVI